MNFSLRLSVSAFILFTVAFSQQKIPNSNPPIHIAFLWHMHQPIYFPYESVVQTDANARYSYSVKDIHNQRTGPYTSWPKNAVAKGLGLPNFGAQVSFSGSLIENLNALEANGNGNFANWKSHWTAAMQWKTALNNPRLDMIGFGYHHPLMGLIDYTDIRRQIQAHKKMVQENFGGTYSKGIFPPENAFSRRMVPALADEGIEWALVDNVHFDRAAKNYPFNTGGNLYEPNKADQVNPDPADWVQLNGLWAPTKNSAAWGRRPHYVQYVDPVTGTSKKIIAVPADRYMGNEDGRGGFGALNYENVMSQLESYNTDPAHPILIVLHHDGDNYGGGTDSYYGSNFQNFVNWVKANPTRFVCTTIQDYLQQYPPAADDIIHIEDGSWSGADNGDPEFKKWNGDPYNGYSPDRNSWGIITAAKNIVFTAHQIAPNDANTLNAWKYLLNAEASDYWYWDGSQNGIWDSHPARGANQAVQYAQQVLGTGSDLTPPTIYLPQREPYNPGATEWNIAQPSDFTVWTYVYDVKGLKSVTLRYRLDADGTNSLSTIHNETYAGGSDVSSWTDIAMTGVARPSQTDPAPLVKAKEFTAEIKGINDKLLDYYVEAEDSSGNIARSPIQHVWVGANTGGGGGGTGNPKLTWFPLAPKKDDSIRITITGAVQNGKLHWGVNNTGSNWQAPNAVYHPAGSVLFNGTGPAVQTPFVFNAADSTLKIVLGPFNKAEQTVHRIAFVINYANNTWDNNGGQDYHIDFGTNDTTVQSSFVMDGSLDASSSVFASHSGIDLSIGWNKSELYVATQSAASQSGDMFIFISDSIRPLKQAQWGKAGQVSGWTLFLGNESSNNWSGWFDKNGAGTSLQNKSGTVLEGYFSPLSVFGKVPTKVYIAVGKYQTADNGTLLAQVPAGNGDGNIDPAEWFEYSYAPLTVRRTGSRPALFHLAQNHPNPFNPSTAISFSLAEDGNASLVIFDLLGRTVAALMDGRYTAGSYEVRWNAAGFPSGLYLYRLHSNGHSITKRMMLLK
ncbi:MAG: T9SS type A sorting domain-containing protein [Bacteroidetes bacterium]|nr:T9SS type A sorting domain-containing protein [Bacteroidota bacterium]